MNRYEDLCNVYEKSREEYFNGRTVAADFASTLFREFKKFINLDTDDFDLLKLVPNREEYDEETTFTHYGAIKYVGGGCWDFAILLRLHMKGNKNLHPSQTIKISFYVKKINEILFYRFDDSLEYSQSSSASLVTNLHSKFFPAVFDQIVKHYQNHLKFLSAEGSESDGEFSLSIR